MASAIDATLPPIASGPNAGKISVNDLRTQLGTAKTEITNLQSGKADKGEVNIFTKAQRSNLVTLTPTLNVYTPDGNAGNFFDLGVLGANATLANFTNLPAAGITQSGSIWVTQDATGGRTLAFGNKYQAAGTMAPILIATGSNAKSRIDYVLSPTGEIQISIAAGISV